MDGVQELTHDGTDGLELLEAAVFDQMAVVGPDVGVVACGAQSGHIEGHAQVTVASLRTCLRSLYQSDFDTKEER